MKTDDTIFTIEYQKSSLRVETIRLPDQVLFRVHFPDSTPPLVICRATDCNEAKFWTSIPEGRLDLATAIGPLIEQYFLAQKT